MSIKLLVSGGREFFDAGHIHHELDKIHKFLGISELIVGDAKGVDAIAAQWAEENRVFAHVFYASWDRYGEAAGPIRNGKMVEAKPDLAMLFPGGRGTINMYRILKKCKIPLYKTSWVPPNG